MRWSTKTGSSLSVELCCCEKSWKARACQTSWVYPWSSLCHPRMGLVLILENHDRMTSHHETLDFTFILFLNERHAH